MLHISFNAKTSLLCDIWSRMSPAYYHGSLKKKNTTTLNFMFFPQSSINDLSFLVFLLTLMYYVYTCTPDSLLPTTTENNEISHLLCVVKFIYNLHIEKE